MTPDIYALIAICLFSVALGVLLGFELGCAHSESWMRPCMDRRMKMIRESRGLE